MAMIFSCLYLLYCLHFGPIPIWPKNKKKLRCFLLTIPRCMGEGGIKLSFLKKAFKLWNELGKQIEFFLGTLFAWSTSQTAYIGAYSCTHSVWESLIYHLNKAASCPSEEMLIAWACEHAINIYVKAILSLQKYSSFGNMNHFVSSTASLPSQICVQFSN